MSLSAATARAVPQGELPRYPPPVVSSLILLSAAGLALSIGLALAGLYLASATWKQ